MKREKAISNAVAAVQQVTGVDLPTEVIAAGAQVSLAWSAVASLLVDEKSRPVVSDSMADPLIHENPRFVQDGELPEVEPGTPLDELEIEQLLQIAGARNVTIPRLARKNGIIEKLIGKRRI